MQANPTCLRVRTVLAAVNDASRRLRRWPAAIIDTGDEFGRPALIKPPVKPQIVRYACLLNECRCTHSATLTRLSATAVMTCCKCVFASPT